MEPGKFYYIDYVVKQKKCDCPCHEEGSKILHMVPCCQDDSFHGVAQCLSKTKTKAKFAWDNYRNTSAELPASKILSECVDVHEIEELKRRAWRLR